MITAASDIHSLSGEREVEIKSCTCAAPALHPDLAGMFLNNSIRDRQTQSCATALAPWRAGLGGEERIVDSLNVFLRNPSARIRHNDTDPFTIRRRNAERTAVGHRILRVQKQVEKNLLQTSGVSMNRRKVLIQIVLQLNP